jgi:hypothetical protein
MQSIRYGKARMARMAGGKPIHADVSITFVIKYTVEEAVSRMIWNDPAPAIRAGIVKVGD